MLKLFCCEATNDECRAYLKDCDNSLLKVLVQYFVGSFVILWCMFNTHDVSGVDSTSVFRLCYATFLYSPLLSSCLSCFN